MEGIITVDWDRLSEVITAVSILIGLFLIGTIIYIIELSKYDSFFDFILSIATVLMVGATAWVALENKKLRDHQSEPIVSVDAQQRSGFHEIIYLVIQNIGLGPAYNIKFKLNSTDFKITPEKHISDIGVIKYGLSYIPPRYELRLKLTSLYDPGFEEFLKNIIEIEVTYENYIGRKTFKIYNINLSRFHGFDSLDYSERQSKQVIWNMRGQTDTTAADYTSSLSSSTDSNSSKYTKLYTDET